MDTRTDTLRCANDVGASSHNQRRETRVATNVAARLVMADMKAIRECKLLDISHNGAKVDIGDWAVEDVPKDFYLLVRLGDSDERLFRWCERRWIVGNTMGVRFCESSISTKELLAILPPDRDVLTSN